MSTERVTPSSPHALLTERAHHLIACPNLIAAAPSPRLNGLRQARCAAPNETFRLLIVEDHALMRDGLRALLELCPDISIVGEATSGREGVRLAEATRPDVILMDLSMPHLNGLEATRQILQARPLTRILILSARSDDDSIAQMASAGAAGFIMKQDTSVALVNAVREVAQGRAYYSPSIAKRLLRGTRMEDRSGRSLTGPKQALTPREAEVLQLVAEGGANKQIAGQLGISVKTVEKHRQQLMDKLDIHETAGLTRHAIETGVIECRLPQSSGETTSRREESLLHPNE